MRDLLVPLIAGLCAAAAATGPMSTCNRTAGVSIYPFTVETLDGQTESMAQYKGQVVLVVNVATY
jgi:cytochrome oxidase Cu insertion factor (SCO1/SenC/PrrC family)